MGDSEGFQGLCNECNTNMCSANASKTVENLLEVMHVLEGLQQAEHLRVLNVHRLQSTKSGD